MPTPTRKAARATTKSSDRQARCDLGKARRAFVASGKWTGVGDSPRLFCGAFDAPGGCRRRVGRGRRRRGLPAPSCYKCKPPARASAEPPPLHPRRRGEASPRGIGGRAHRARARGAWQALPRAHAAAHGVAAACPNVNATSAAQAARRDNPLGSSSNDSPMFSSAAHRLRFSRLLPRGKASIPPRRLDAADGSQCHGALWRRIQRFDPSAAQIHHQLVGKHAQRFPAADRGQLDESQADVVTGHL